MRELQVYCLFGAVRLYLVFVRMAYIASHCKNAVAPTAHDYWGAGIYK